jgi:DNA-binding transcriptional regulator YiaG
MDILSGEGKLTLRTHTERVKEQLPELGVDEPIELRERLGMSRAVFAICLRTNPRTRQGGAGDG